MEIIFYIICIVIILFAVGYAFDLFNEFDDNIAGVCSTRRLFNLNELSFFKIVTDGRCVKFCKVLRHNNVKYDYESYYCLYYESICKDIYDNELKYTFNTCDYTIIKNADNVVCSERDNFLNNAIPINEEEYNKAKQEFMKFIN